VFMSSGSGGDIIDYRVLLSLLCVRCIFVYALEEIVSTLPLVYGIKMLKLVRDIFGDCPCVKDLLNLGVDRLKDSLKKAKIVQDIQIKRNGNILTIHVVGCVLARQLHSRMSRKEHLCPWVLMILLAMGPRIFLNAKFTKRYPYITEDGAIAEFEIVEQ